MTALWIALLAMLMFLAIVALVAWIAWQRSDEASKELVRRIVRLGLRAKFRLAYALVRESRIPLVARAIPVLLIIYLALPIDVIPDFIPVIGHVDDLLILGIGVAALLRLTSRDVLEEHVSRLETEASAAHP